MSIAFPLIFLEVTTSIHGKMASEYPQRMYIPSPDIFASTPRQFGA